MESYLTKYAMQAGQQLSTAAFFQKATMSSTTAAHPQTGAKVRELLTYSVVPEYPTDLIEIVPLVCRTLTYQVLAFQ